eukprot:7382740-Prymnesium_polylepis.2
MSCADVDLVPRNIWYVPRRRRWRPTLTARSSPWRLALSPRKPRRTRSKSPAKLFRESVPIEGGLVHVLHDVCKGWGGSCGSVLWTASPALVDWLGAERSRLDNLIADRSIVELGGGLGFVGTCLHRMGAARVLVTEVPRQLPILRHNLRCNAHREGGAAVQCCSFVWGGRPRRVFSHVWDLVVACDVVYNVSDGSRTEAFDCCLTRSNAFLIALVDHVPALADAIAALLESGTPRALLALPDRVDFGFHLKASDGDLVLQKDYELLLRDLSTRLQGALDVEILDTIDTPPDPGDAPHAVGNRIVLLLLSRGSDGESER